MPGLYSCATILWKSDAIFGYCENPDIIFWKRTKGRNIKFWVLFFFCRIGKASQFLIFQKVGNTASHWFLKKKKNPVLCAINVRFPFQKEPCPAQSTQQGCREPTVLMPVSTVCCSQTWPTGHPCPCSKEEQCTWDQVSTCFLTVSAGTGEDDMAAWAVCCISDSWQRIQGCTKAWRY